jgi:hypothetical protein
MINERGRVELIEVIQDIVFEIVELLHFMGYSIFLA